MWYEKLVYKGLFPDAVIRRVIRWQLKRYHNKISKLSDIDLTEIRAEFLKSTSTGAIAIETKKANLQHYEFSTSFYQNILGPSLKYSGSIWNEDHHNVADADLATLKTYSDRAVIQNGQSILDLGNTCSPYINSFSWF